jgi:LPS-assembly protein
MACVHAGTAVAQTAPDAAPAEQPAAAAIPPKPADIIDFAADQVTYDSNADVITASGQVRMSRDGNYLAADTVTWDRKSGQVRAAGNVVDVTPERDSLIR